MKKYGKIRKNIGKVCLAIALWNLVCCLNIIPLFLSSLAQFFIGANEHGIDLFGLLCLLSFNVWMILSIITRAEMIALMPKKNAKSKNIANLFCWMMFAVPTLLFTPDFFLELFTAIFIVKQQIILWPVALNLIASPFIDAIEIIYKKEKTEKKYSMPIYIYTILIIAIILWITLPPFYFCYITLILN